MFSDTLFSLSSAKHQSEIINFCFIWRTWTTTSVPDLDFWQFQFDPSNICSPATFNWGLTCFHLIVFVPGSMLHAMFSGRFDTKPSEDGSYFIDRDGTHFRYILNYLRTGQLIVPNDEITREELLAEAEFYRAEGIIKALTASPFQDSVILSSEQCHTLMDWLKETGAIADITMASDNLLYRASRDGWAASNFHSCCDNKGPTVTVVKSENYIFGGYTEHEWKGNNHWLGLHQRGSFFQTCKFSSFINFRVFGFVGVYTDLHWKYEGTLVEYKMNRTNSLHCLYNGQSIYHLTSNPKKFMNNGYLLYGKIVFR